MPASNKNEKQVMDVSKPGKSVPSASAKPVIVGHKPMVQDPMVTAEADPEVKATEPETLVVVASPAASKKVIAPLTEETKPDPTDEQISQDKNEDSTSDSSVQTEESVVVDAVIDQVGDKKDAILEPNEEDRKKQEQLEKLVAEKKYFVPLGKVNGKSSHTMLVITLLLLVIFLGLIVAIDAEILDAGFELPFDFI